MKNEGLLWGWWVKNAARWKKGNLRSDQGDSLAIPHLVRYLRYREATGLASVSWLAENRSGAKAPARATHTPGMSHVELCAAAVDFKQEFFMHQTDSRPCINNWIWHVWSNDQHSYSIMLTALHVLSFPSLYIFIFWEAHRGYPWQVEPLSSMQGARHPNSF